MIFISILAISSKAWLALALADLVNCLHVYMEPKATYRLAVSEALVSFFLYLYLPNVLSSQNLNVHRPTTNTTEYRTTSYNDLRISLKRYGFIIGDYLNQN